MTKRNTEKYKLPPGKNHMWLAIVNGEVQKENIPAPSHYFARELARTMYAQEDDSAEIVVGLLAPGMELIVQAQPEKKAKTKKRVTRSKRNG